MHTAREEMSTLSVSSYVLGGSGKSPVRESYVNWELEDK